AQPGARARAAARLEHVVLIASAVARPLELQVAISRGSLPPERPVRERTRPALAILLEARRTDLPGHRPRAHFELTRERGSLPSRIRARRARRQQQREGPGGRAQRVNANPDG